jgi:hypothetical protein
VTRSGGLGELEIARGIVARFDEGTTDRGTRDGPEDAVELQRDGRSDEAGGGGR